MLYYSLNHKSPRVNFREATIHGQAPDKGLYFPEEIPILPNDFIADIEHYSKKDIAWRGTWKIFFIMRLAVSSLF